MTGARSLEQGLRSLGLGQGDDVVVHSSLRAIGGVEGGAATVVSAITAVLGPGGTLVVPTFNYGIGLADPVDLASTPARTGAVAEAVRALRDSKRSDHPTHPVSAVGARAPGLTAGHLGVRALGVGSPLDRLAANGGKVLLLGVGHVANSTVHVGEERAGMPKPAGGEPVTVRVRCLDGRLEECTLDSSTSCSAAFGAVEAELRERGAVVDGRVGSALAQLMEGEAVVDAVRALLRQRPDALLCTWPGCGPCSRSRSALEGRHRLC